MTLERLEEINNTISDDFTDRVYMVQVKFTYGPDDRFERWETVFKCYSYNRAKNIQDEFEIVFPDETFRFSFI